ncbi:MAG: hypothetical protein IPG45_09910 [Deltaproteobacteria bacterium]|nr:hypothetical protein [Deltaproteobacteria bacterium]
MSVDKVGLAPALLNLGGDELRSEGRLEWLSPMAKREAIHALLQLQLNLDEQNPFGVQEETLALLAKDDPNPTPTTPPWLKGKTPPKTPVPPDYQRALKQFGAKDSEEFRQKYLQGFDEADYTFLLPPPAPRSKPNGSSLPNERRSPRTKVTPPPDPYALIPETPEPVRKKVNPAEYQANLKLQVDQKRGFDDGTRYVLFSRDERVRLAKLGETTDIREETLRSAIEQSGLGYDPAAVDQIMAEINDDNSVEKSSSAEVRAKLMNPGTYQFGLSPELRRRLYRTSLVNQGDPNLVKGFDLKANLNDEARRIEKEFAAIEPKDNLHRAFLDYAKANALRDNVDRLTAASDWDPRNGTEQQLRFNGVADGIEGGFRSLLAKHPVYSLLPQSVQDQVAKYGLGVIKGGTSLVGTAKGVNDFVRDVVQDLVLSGAEESGLGRALGVDTQKLRGQLETSRQQDAQRWRDLTGAQTADMARQDLAYQTKVDLGLRTTPYDVPNWAVKAGEMSAKAAPYLLVGLATGGASLPVQVGVNAAVGGLTAGGEIYNQTRQQPQALKAAVFGAANGAIAPLGNRLGYSGDLALNTATGYITTKLQNPDASDDELMFGIINQAAMSGAFKAGSSTMNALSKRAGRPITTPEDAQATYRKLLQEDLPTIKEEVANSAKVQTREVTVRLEDEARQPTTQRPKTAAVLPRPRTDQVTAELPPIEAIVGPRPLPKAGAQATAQSLVTRLGSYEAVHDPNFTAGMGKSIDEAVVGLRTARAKGAIDAGTIEQVMSKVMSRRQELQIGKVERDIDAANRHGKPWSEAKKFAARREALLYGDPIPANDSSRERMLDVVSDEPNDRHRPFFPRTKAMAEVYAAQGDQNLVTIEVDGKPRQVQLSSIAEHPLQKGLYLVEHPPFGDSRIITQRGYEILAEVANNKDLTETQAMEKIAEAHYLLMHGTPSRLGSPAIVEATIDAVLRERFGKTMPRKKVGIEPFWEAVLSQPGEQGKRDYIRRFRGFYE